MDPFKHGNDPHDNPLYGFLDFLPMDEPNISPSQQNFLNPQPQGHVSNSSFSQHGTFNTQSQRRLAPKRQATTEYPVIPQLPPSPIGQPMPQFAPQWSQPYAQLGPQSAPRALNTIEFEALMSHPPWPQSLFQDSPLAPRRHPSDWMKPQESLAQSKVQEPTQNFTPSVSGAQSSFYGPLPKEQYDAQKSHLEGRPTPGFDMSHNMLWDEPPDNFRLNRHDEQLGPNLSPLKRPSASFDSSSLPKRQRFPTKDSDNTETMEKGNGENSPQLPGPNNAEVMGGHIGDNSAPLSKSNNDEALGVGNGHNLASDLRGQLLSRNYFVFHMDKGFVLSYSNLNATALSYVLYYINQILPTVKREDIISTYKTMVQMEMSDPAMDGKSFEDRLIYRNAALLKHFHLDPMTIPDICHRLVVTCSNRTVPVIMLNDGRGFQPLIALLCLLKKKVIFMADFEGDSGDAMLKGHLDLVLTNTINMVGIPALSVLARAPVYIRDFFGVNNPMMEEVLKAPAMVLGSKEDQLLKRIMEDLSCKEDDTVFVGSSTYPFEPPTLPELLQVDTTALKEDSQVSSTQRMRYKVDTYTTLEEILAGKFQ
ncbi:hypothetical protein sscle_05g045630 [Sclerotinia sclerotiorum 1980 UF-70]|uniref:Uncharacterized protein n=1 Tax=Sclerotinia sclerotiorum (strain ATCC 18683 / 1980 / Ss-1) TaxID=665079 RepID=A0A1D9Q5D8_SCLS1|nr:hypothetical protein sscle_05g045630 [Sclerotinia sclerotiorum 1980 UF-70]